MINDPRFQPPKDSGGSAGNNPGDEQDWDPLPQEEPSDPFFKDPAEVLDKQVAESLATDQEPAPLDQRESGNREVIRDGYTAEAPHEFDPSDYDASSYGAQLAKMMKNAPREQGMDARDLAAIYAKRREPEDTFTMKEGAPQREFSVWEIPGFRLLLKVLILTVVTVGLFSIHLNIVDEDGVDTSRRLPFWIYEYATMSTEQQLMQEMEPGERQFILTLTRIKRVAGASSRYELNLGKPPRTVFDLVDENLLLATRMNDGWGNNFRLEIQVETVMVRSAGKDRTFETDDDISMLGDFPIEYSASHYSQELDYMPRARVSDLDVR